MSEEITVTLQEQKIIKALERISKDWPRDLMLFSGGHSLSLVRVVGDELYSIPANLGGITHDSGDPFIIRKDLEVEYEKKK